METVRIAIFSLLKNEPLPIGLNRISWKPSGNINSAVSKVNSLPIGLNRISWKQYIASTTNIAGATLPIGLNRISWKRKGTGGLGDGVNGD